MVKRFASELRTVVGDALPVRACIGPARAARIVAGAALCASLAVAARAASVDFTRDVQPILAEHCFHCHGPDDKDRKGGLRLDVREPALKGGKSELAAIVPGQPEASEIVQRILATDEEEIMPPPAEKKPLSSAQKDVLRRWIADGAAYAPHWAFQPPVKAPLPSGDQGSEPAHPVDAFVSAKLKAVGLTPSPPAEAATLGRRLYLDLIGLPPSPQEVAGFEADARGGLAQAAEKLAARLLDDERFGERWARVWLDAAR